MHVLTASGIIVVSNMIERFHCNGQELDDFWLEMDGAGYFRSAVFSRLEWFDSHLPHPIATSLTYEGQTGESPRVKLIEFEHRCRSCVDNRMWRLTKRVLLNHPLT